LKALETKHTLSANANKDFEEMERKQFSGAREYFR
jgi:hypothetical protein